MSSKILMASCGPLEQLYQTYKDRATFLLVYIAEAHPGTILSVPTADGGRVSASFTAAPTTLRAVARVGAVDLQVPGNVSYKVSADAHVGHADVGVRQSSSSGHVITAITDVGGIKVSAST